MWMVESRGKERRSRTRRKVGLQLQQVDEAASTYVSDFVTL